MNKQELVHAILQTKRADCHPEWNRHCHNLIRELLQKNPDNFMDFQAIRETMFVGNAEYTFEQFKDLQHEINLNDIIDCDIFSKNHQHPRFTTTGNTIHHRYHLYMFEQNMGCRIIDRKNILELGGGYGNTARIIKRMGFSGEYSIKDLPEFSLLQQYYLSYYDISINHDVDFDRHYNLFISTWSLSELLLEDRVPYEYLDADYFLIAYGPSYSDIDNTEYFRYFITQYPKHSFRLLETPYQNNQYYLIGGPK